MIFLFFFEFHVKLLNLHSFPTRRSSDLRTGAPALNRALAEQGGVQDRSSRGSARGAGTAGAAGNAGAASDARAGGDRKSTRLNSSHVAISYAVFCLKKKTK